MNDDALRKRQRIPGIYTRLVDGAGVKPAELASQYGVSEKTIRRDLRDMMIAGVPLFSQDGVWRLAGVKRSRSQIALSMSEAVSLFFALRCYHSMPGSPMAIEVEKAMDKLRPLLPAGADKALAASESRYSVTFPAVEGYEGKEEMIDTIEWAIDGGISLVITYVAPVTGEASIREVDPYAMHFSAGQWYLVGRCRLRQDVRMFRIDRITDCRESSNTFERPVDFTIQAYLGNTWRILRGEPVHVVIDFSPGVRPWVGRAAWHPTQRLEEAGGGWLRMHLDVPDNVEIGDWVMSFGGGAVVREPESLRNRVVGALRRGVANYETMDDSGRGVAASESQ